MLLVLELSILVSLGYFLDVIWEGQRQLHFLLRGGRGSLSLPGVLLVRRFLLFLLDWFAMIFCCQLNEVLQLLIILSIIRYF